MNRWVLPIVAVLFFGTATAHAQVAQATQPTQVVAPTTGQNPAADPSTPQTSEKKVWTNEDLSALDTREGISTIGRTTENATKRVVPSKSHDPKWYQDQIVKLQAKIPPLDSQIADLQAALGGKPTGDAKKSVRLYGAEGGRLVSGNWRNSRKSATTRSSK